MRSPIKLTPTRLTSPMGNVTLRSPLGFDPVRLYSPMPGVPIGTGELDWGLPLYSDSEPTIYIRMNGDFTIPVDGAPETTIALDPQVSPPTGKFPVQVDAATEHVDLLEVVFV